MRIASLLLVALAVAAPQAAAQPAHAGHGHSIIQPGQLGPGSVAIMPPGAPMFGFTREETVIQLHGTGPWGLRYLNPADDPRRN